MKRYYVTKDLSDFEQVYGPVDRAELANLGLVEISHDDALAIAQAEVAALRELTRWHPWPDERPPKVSTYIMQTVFRDVYLDVWEDDQWVGTQDAQALQWAYLPEPYKEAR